MTEAEGGAPTFSVLCASFNQSGYVEETLDSVARQTLPDFEIVVVNDGSTDDTEAVVSRWMERFRAGRPGVRAVLETVANAGQSAALEHGFTLCRGRYVALLDSDDRWLPRKLEAVAGAIAAAPEVGMVVHPLWVIDAAGRRTGDVRPRRARLSDGDLRDRVRRTSRIAAPATSGMVLRRDVFARLLPMPTRAFPSGADLYLALGASLHAPVRALAEPLAEYRMHPDGQHIRAMLSAGGLQYWVDLQAAVIGHLGLHDAVARNSYFLRHEFALAKLRDGVAQQLRALLRLERATWEDDAFGPAGKLLFAGFWAACAVAPRPLFRRMWRTFQLRQTGFDKIGLTRAPRSAPTARA